MHGVSPSCLGLDLILKWHHNKIEWIWEWAGKDGELESFLLHYCWASNPSSAVSGCCGQTLWQLWLAFHPLLEPNSIFFWIFSSSIPVSSFIYFPMGYPSASLSSHWCWWLGGTERFPGTALTLIHHTAVQIQPALSTLCTSADMQHFFFSLEFLVSLSSRWLFPYYNTTQSFTRCDSAPVRSLCTAQEEADICSFRLRSDWPQHVSGAWGQHWKEHWQNHIL